MIQEFDGVRLMGQGVDIKDILFFDSDNKV
jgi:hypothetical protein